MTLTKIKIVHQVSTTLSLKNKDEAAAMVEAFFKVVKNSFIEGEHLLISRFGKFHIRDKKRRIGRNPRTGEEAIIEPRRVVTFAPSGILRRRVNDKNASETTNRKES